MLRTNIVILFTEDYLTIKKNMINIAKYLKRKKKCFTLNFQMKKENCIFSI